MTEATKQEAPEPRGIAPGRPRIAALDIIRGAVMVLMALDHVRVFAAVPAGGDTPALFFTRWITNFCAPAFIFLAGSGAFLHGETLHDRGALSRYLLVRGMLLVVLEMTVSRLSWTFNLDFHNYTEANVIWAIGWSMMGLAALVHLPLRMTGAFGVAVIAGHNLLDRLPDALAARLAASPFAHLLQLLYFGGEFRWLGTGPKLVVLYTIIPWIGVIAAGYAFGSVMRLDPARRRRLCLQLGAGAIALFLVLRGFGLYGNPWPWDASGGAVPSLLSFLGTNKYPASLQFLLMTLGPVIVLIPLLERAEGRVVSWLITFGRVPLFYYLLHLPLIHGLAVLISLVRTPAATGWLFLNHPLRIPPAPEGYRYSLPMLYGVTAIAVTLLYVPCRWYASLKARRGYRWLSYL